MSRVEKAPEPKPCTGWIIRNGFVAECGQMFTRKRGTAVGHAKCLERKRNLEKTGYSVGDQYRRWAIVKSKHAPVRCTGWVIRDHMISECGESFTPKRGSRFQNFYHLNSCCNHKQQWQAVGYKLGDSVLRTCAYRKCGATFDRTKRSTSGDYYCPETSHGTLEKLARIADKWATKLAAAEQRAAEAEQSRGGRPSTKAADQEKYGPRVWQLKRVEDKSWGELTMIMNRENPSDTRTASGWRKFLPDTRPESASSL